VAASDGSARPRKQRRLDGAGHSSNGGMLSL